MKCEVLVDKCLLYLVNDVDFFLSHRLPIAKAAKSSGFEVHVATPCGEGVRRVNEEGFVHHVVPMRRGGIGFVKDLSTLIGIYKVFKQVKPDLVHMVTIKPVLYGGMIARLVNIPALVSAVSGLGHVFSSYGLFQRVRQWIVQGIYRVALSNSRNKVILQNEDDKQEFLSKRLARECQIILIKGSGVDLTSFSYSEEPDGIPVVMMASRMIRDKGVVEFVNAARILLKVGVRARFVLVGDTDKENPTAISASQLASWEDHAIVEWWRWKKDMQEVLPLANIVCLPSYREGLPKVLLEAAACGRSIVATDVPGCREIVAHNENGLLVPARKIEPLAQAIKYLVSESKVRQRMGKQGRIMVEKGFSVENVVSETLAVYSKLLT